MILKPVTIIYLNNTICNAETEVSLPESASQLNTEQRQPDDQPQLEIFPIGSVDAMSVSVVAANLQAILGLNTKVQVPLPEPEYAFLPRRGQYDSGRIIQRLAADKCEMFRLGVVNVDICTPILTFVYGESQLGGKTALVSLYRISSENHEKAYSRAAKISVHEVGHLLGIAHCLAPDCLMGFSNNLDKLDSLPLRFCKPCEYEVKRNLRHLFNMNGGKP